MASVEDCASVLEQFVHDGANLPAEITHMMEEITAKDDIMRNHHKTINAQDGQLQKHVRLHGGLQPHPNEKEFAVSIVESYDSCHDLQSQKILLAERAVMLLDRQVKRLDVKIRELQNDGQLTDDPPIPSLFSRKSQQIDHVRNWQSEIHAASTNALRVTSGNVGHPHPASMQRPQVTLHHSSSTGSQVNRQVPQIVTTQTRNPVPATPASAHPTVQQRFHRESSASAADPNKRRRLNPTLGNLPAASSNLRQSSLGPGTPKAGTPTGTSALGPKRGTSADPRASQPSGHGIKTKGINATSNTKKVAPHQQINKLKSANKKRLSGLSSSSSTRKKGNTPSSRRGGVGATSDDESVLSSATPSDTESTATSTRGGAGSGRRAGRPKKTADQSASARPSASPEPDNEAEDSTPYCFCHQPSYGDMVACENDSCPFEWFHLKCVGLRETPGEEEVWFCPACTEGMKKEQEASGGLEKARGRKGK